MRLRVVLFFGGGKGEGEGSFAGGVGSLGGAGVVGCLGVGGGVFRDSSRTGVDFLGAGFLGAGFGGVC